LSGKDHDPGRLAPDEYTEVVGLSDIENQVAMSQGRGRLQHRKDPGEAVLVEVVVGHGLRLRRAHGR
jgi:hypothetical protein